MSPDELKVRARRVPDELVTQGDLAVADDVFAPHIGGTKRWVTALRQAFPDLCAIVEDEIAEGDTVVQRLTYRGTHAGTFLGLPPTGSRVTWQAMEIRRLGPDGKFTEQWVLADLLGLLQQLGAVPSTIGTGWDEAGTTTCDR
jgi:predicted ester cyclase